MLYPGANGEGYPSGQRIRVERTLVSFPFPYFSFLDAGQRYALVVFFEERTPERERFRSAELAGRKCIIQYVFGVMGEQFLRNTPQLRKIRVPVIIKLPEMQVYPMGRADDAELVIGIDLVVVEKDIELVVAGRIFAEVLHLDRAGG